MASANCCMNCEKRHFKCHSTCEEYAEFLIQAAEKKEKISNLRERLNSNWSVKDAVEKPVRQRTKKQ